MINIDKQDKIVRSCRSCVKLWGKHTERYGNHFCSQEMIIYFPQTVKGMRRQCQLWAILDNYADITANYGVRMNLEKELEIKLIGCFILVAIIPFLFGWWFNPMTDTEGWYHAPGYLCIFCVSFPDQTPICVGKQKNVETQASGYPWASRYWTNQWISKVYPFIFGQCLPAGNQTWAMENPLWMKNFMGQFLIFMVCFPARHVWLPEGTLW